MIWTPDASFGDVQDWASFMFIYVLGDAAEHLSDEKCVEQGLHMPLGYIFVIDPKFGGDAFYKLPAGHRKFGENSVDTAVREVRGETGLLIPYERVRYAGKWLSRRRDHWKVLFSGHVFEHELSSMNDQDPENEGEQPRFFSVDAFYECVRAEKFMAEHYRLLDEAVLILPLGRDKARA